MTNRVLLGIFGGVPVFRVSRPNIDVTTNPNTTDFAISEQSFPIPPLASGQINMAANAQAVITRDSTLLTVPVLEYFATSSSVPTRQYLAGNKIASRVSLNTDEIRFYNQTGESIILTYYLYNRDFTQ